MDSRSDSIITVPLGYPTSTIFIDESGSRATSGNFFIVGAVKARNPGRITRRLKAAREQTGFAGEFKFADVTKGSLPAYCHAIDVLIESDAHFAACVVQRSIADPFHGCEFWEAHRDVTSLLVRACINRRELVSVVMDGISTPVDVALDEEVQRRVNGSFRNVSVISSLCVDSKTHDLVQMADLFAGAVLFDRRQRANTHGSNRSSSTSPKARLSARVLDGLNLSSFEDGRSRRVNIQTYRSAQQSVTVLNLRKRKVRAS